MEAKSSCTTTCISPPAAPLYRSQTEPTLDASRQYHQKSLSADVASQSRKPESTKHQLPGKTRIGQSTSNIPTHLPRPKHKESAPPKPLANSTPPLNTELQSHATGTNPLSPASELSTTTSQSLSPRKDQQNPGNSELRFRRPPASHSSYGIETSTGPPPSFSTQRTRSEDRMWKPPTPESSDASPTLKRGFFAGDMSAPHDHGDGISPTYITATDRDNFETSDATDLGKEAQLKSEDHNTRPYPSEQGSLALPRINGYAKGGVDGADTADSNSPSSGEDQQSGKSEDIFLQIAKSETGRPKTSPQSDRTSRLPSAYAPQRYSERNGDRFPISPGESTFPPFDALPSSRTDGSRNTSKRSSLTYRPSAASAHPHDDISRPRYLSGSKSAVSSAIGRDISDMSPGLPQVSDRNFSNTDRTYRTLHPPLPRTTRVSAGAESDRQRFEGTESTVSTAVSNCFDDLHDLKSRIVRLEQARKLPSSSAAAMSNERPRTAATTITTMSSSPKHRIKKNDSPAQALIGGVPSTVHPLLHEALAKAKPVVSTEIYQRLEATATDALQLASMLGSGGGSSGGSTIGPTSSVERQLRRRGDSMCRGLTELAIALSAESTIQSPQVVRPVSRDVNSPEDTQLTIARVQSRLESRRRSLMAGATLPESPEVTSPETTFNSSQTRPSSSRLNRRSLLRYRHEDEPYDGTVDEDRNLSLRPASRAMTELGGTTLVSRSSPRDRNFSREYTSQHPLPGRDRNDHMISHNSSIPSRRTYVSPAPAPTDLNNSSPLTPSFQSRSGLRRYGGSVDRASTVDSSVDNTPDSGGSRLSKPQRRSLGLGSQLSGLGSTVRSRLRAARTERLSAGQAQQEPTEDAGITALPVASHRAVHAR